jgi:arsenate reductase
MAAAWFTKLADSSKARALSAGTDPGARVHPEVLEAMKEVGVDLSQATPQRLTDELAGQASMLITMGCGEDPKGKPIDRVREIREEVRLRVTDLLRRRGWGSTAAA